MEIFEITGYRTGVSRAGVNYLQPSDSFQDIKNGYIYRQILQSREGIGHFAPRLTNGTRVFGIFEHTLIDSTTELLVCDETNMYKFNTVTGVFDVIPFAGSLAAYPGFQISSNDFYISGTSYPTKGYQSRFVFTGVGITPMAGGSSIFYYDGTDIKDFTVDNLDFAAPPQGSLTKASYVVWFNERLTFFIPTIANIEYLQGILYSGIRTSTGNGDKFNVAGSGLLQADTYEVITGVQILGQVISMSFDRSIWTLEKTRDAFNPYFIRKVPSVLGANANFSSVSWFNTTMSVGKTGIISTDGRGSVRIDDKIPYFTNNEIDAVEFNMTYGGFDRINNQFLWSFKKSGSESTTQDAVLVFNYEEQSWSVYDQRFSVFGQSNIGLNLTWNDIEYVAPNGNVSWASWDTTEEIWDRIGLGKATQKTLAGDDLGFIYDINQGFDDYTSSITNVTIGATTTLTVTQVGILAGDKVVVSNVEGMTELNNYDTATSTFTNKIYTVITATPTSLEIDVDSTQFTAYTPNTGQIAKPINFEARTIPFNPYRDQGLLCYISQVEFLIDNNGASLYVDVFMDEQDSPFKANVLLKPNQSSPKSREWISMTVNNEANFHTFVMKQSSPGVQLKITSMRIHARPGGFTSD